MLCKFCENEAVEDRPTCYKHCPKNDHGEHSIGRYAHVADDGAGEGEILLDLYCRHCDQATGFRIKDEDVTWS
jgi:hypothetical protein